MLDIDRSTLRIRAPVLSVAADAVRELQGSDALYGLWTRTWLGWLSICVRFADGICAVFTKCKESLQDGRRLENLSWRLWYRSMNPRDNPGKGFHSQPYEIQRSLTRSQAPAKSANSSSTSSLPILSPSTLTHPTQSQPQQYLFPRPTPALSSQIQPQGPPHTQPPRQHLSSNPSEHTGTPTTPAATTRSPCLSHPPRPPRVPPGPLRPGPLSLAA